MEKIISHAISERVEFVLIAGDIYDKEDQSIKAQVQFYKEMKRLEEARIDVFLIHGNHDFLEQERDRLELPKNVHTFSSDVSCVPWQSPTGTKIHFYGFSYDKRHIRENRLGDYRKHGDADFHIALLHGSEETKASEHDVYAPFGLKEMKQKGFDYWALGHIHKREILSSQPGIYYPGNIQGRSKKETGAKGGTIVELSEMGATFSFFETAPVMWEKKQIVLEGKADRTEIYRATDELFQTYRDTLCSYVIDLEIVTEQASKFDADEWLQLFEEMRTESPFVWINTLRFIEKNQAVSDKWYQGQFLADELDASLAELMEDETFF
ncbi:Ser/Thr protein phosphatase family protein [Listeria floridensis FSL S10-1187]|uniref:Ser/Thr protein phosphatase family protein n=1 Tax=Listeria floridensis FSL S10-1187 TaxID=1265817 RepID=A0ABP3B105_9LIST|nr:DNA repair exonuclease [Listeria floridensis]EUJ33605.1 Ser/Thr protein phosphatase family protein [Listeria floridensis FSL S10-1187]